MRKLGYRQHIVSAWHAVQSTLCSSSTAGPEPIIAQEPCLLCSSDPGHSYIQPRCTSNGASPNTHFHFPDLDIYSMPSFPIGGHKQETVKIGNNIFSKYLILAHVFLYTYQKGSVPESCLFQSIWSSFLTPSKVWALFYRVGRFGLTREVSRPHFKEFWQCDSSKMGMGAGRVRLQARI